MKLSTSHKRKPMDVNMTPMIDVVFQLLIFFMTCSQVSDVNRESLELPKLKGSEDQAQSEIIANIDETGKLTVSGQPMTVPDFIVICLEEARTSHGNDASELTVVIRADRRGTCRTVNELVTGLTKLGVRKVRFAVSTES